jgi:hypothetical protein
MPHDAHPEISPDCANAIIHNCPVAVENIDTTKTQDTDGPCLGPNFLNVVHAQAKSIHSVVDVETNKLVKNLQYCTFDVCNTPNLPKVLADGPK